MSSYLLDTHTAIWFFNGDNSLSETAKHIILDPSNTKNLSIASAWELAIKIGLGKLDFAEGMTLITADENITRYDVPYVW